MYDPSIGRWMEEDPIGFSAGDMNLYRYLGNSPVNATDPNGLQIQFGEGHILTFAEDDYIKKEYGYHSVAAEIVNAMHDSDVEGTVYHFASLHELISEINFRLDIIEAATALAKKEKGGFRFGGRSEDYMAQWLNHRA
jgi:uncharacterized protein RhaS with RHS repeats